MNTKELRKKLEGQLSEIKDSPQLNNQVISGIAFKTGFSTKTVSAYINGEVSDLEMAEKIVDAALEILNAVEA